MSKRAIIWVSVACVLVWTLIIRVNTTLLARPVLKVIVSELSTGEVKYQAVYDNKKVRDIEEFDPEEIEVYELDRHDIQSEIVDGHIANELRYTDLTDQNGNKVEADDTMKRMMQKIADITDHAIFETKLIKHKDDYYAFVMLNVNLWTPCILYRYDPKKNSLKKLHTWDDCEVTGIAEL